MKKLIIVISFVFLGSISWSAFASDCECKVQNEKGNASECGLLWFVYNNVTCSEITFTSGVHEIPLEAAITLNNNSIRIIGNVDANKNPTVTLKAKNVSSGYLVRLTGTHTNGKPTLENLNIQASGKTGIYIDGNGHILKNVRVLDSKIGVEIVGNKNQITGAGNRFYNNTEVGVKIDTGDFNHISQALVYGNGPNEKCTSDNGSDDNCPGAIKRVNTGNSSGTFKPATDMSVVGLMVSGQKKLYGITGFADPDLNPVGGEIELFEADTSKLAQALGQGIKYVTKKDVSSPDWVWGKTKKADDNNNIRRFGAVMSNLDADTHYTLTSIAKKTINETSEFSNAFSADDEMIIGGQACLGKTWYLYALDGYDMNGKKAACYENEMNGAPPDVTPCTGDPWLVDSDLDGMPNGLEDKNFNCNPNPEGKPDTGETNPIVPNTKCELFPKLPECPDTDKDGVPNIKDNCPLIANPEQENGDGDKFGDVCDKCPNDTEGADDLDQNGNPIDTDGDGTPDICDNCPDKFNNQKYDEDDDGIGDACEEQPDNDLDDDGILNDKDNCPNTPNPKQQDIDGDKVGDACDNCKYKKNADQADADEDGVGDACEGDRDSDGIIDDKDNCIDDPNFDQANIDDDKYGDVCDNCPDDDNQDQTDTDKDGVGDICDNCETEPNAEQDDLDNDALGDICDDDMDGDGIPNIGDNCPTIYNKDQADSDADGIGDRCDIDPSVSPDIGTGAGASAFGDIEGGGGHVSSQGGCSGDIGLAASGETSNLLISIALLGLPTSIIFIRRRFFG